MSKIWIKMYPEMLHDRKMRKLTEHEQLVFMKLLLLAGQEDQDGALPSAEDIALELYIKETDVTKVCKKLIDAGMLTVTEDGYMYVTNFKKRQDTNLTGAEKVARYRERQRVTEESAPETDTQVTPVTETEVTPVTNVTKKKVTRVTEAGYTCNENVTPELDIDIDKELDKEKEKELINKAAKAAAREKPGKTKLTPDQPEFWKHAFGPEAERAKAFSKASGIIPIGTEFGRWQKDLRDFTEAGISNDQMIAAVAKIRREGKYPIKAPGTVLTEARNMTAAALAPSNTAADYLSDLEWEGCDE